MNLFFFKKEKSGAAILNVDKVYSRTGKPTIPRGMLHN